MIISMTLENLTPFLELTPVVDWQGGCSLSSLNWAPLSRLARPGEGMAVESLELVRELLRIDVIGDER